MAVNTNQPNNFDAKLAEENFFYKNIGARSKVVNGEIILASGIPADISAMSEQDLADQQLWNIFRTTGIRPGMSAEQIAALSQPSSAVGDGETIMVNGKPLNRTETQKKFGITVLTAEEARANGLNIPLGSNAPVFTDLGIPTKKGVDSKVNAGEPLPLIASNNIQKDLGNLLQERVQFDTDVETSIKGLSDSKLANHGMYQIISKQLEELKTTTHEGNSAPDRDQYDVTVAKAEEQLRKIEDSIMTSATKEIKAGSDYKLAERSVIYKEEAFAIMRRADAMLNANSDQVKLVQIATGVTNPKQAGQIATTPQGKKFLETVAVNNGQAAPLYKDQGDEILNQWNRQLAISQSTGAPEVLERVEIALTAAHERARLNALQQVTTLRTTDPEYMQLDKKEATGLLYPSAYAESYKEIVGTFIAKDLLAITALKSEDKEVAQLGSLIAAHGLDAKAIKKAMPDANLSEIANKLGSVLYDTAAQGDSITALKKAGVTSGTLGTMLYGFNNALRAEQLKSESSIFGSLGNTAELNKVLSTVTTGRGYFDIRG